MTLREIIDRLEQEEDKDRIIPIGFTSPHSYRGYYKDLAVEPAYDVTIRHMVEILKSCVGRIFEGYKGGEFTMENYSDVWIAEYGTTYNANKIGPLLLEFLLCNETLTEFTRSK